MAHDMKSILTQSGCEVLFALPDHVSQKHYPDQLYLSAFPDEAYISRDEARQVANALLHWADSGELPDWLKGRYEK